MATRQTPIIKELDEQEVLRQRQAIRTLPKEKQLQLMEEGIKMLREKLNGVDMKDLLKVNPHLIPLLEQKLIPEPNELSIAFEKLMNEKPTQPLLVNDVEYELKKGIKTPSGYYKNGWNIRDVKGDGKWKQITIYTSRQNEVDWEHRIMFKLQKNGLWKLVVLEGFNGINLLQVDTIGNNESYVLEYLNTLLKRN